jgi:CRP/FNR family transcriptional regulator, cyclic AMP receptor protein
MDASATSVNPTARARRSARTGGRNACPGLADTPDGRFAVPARSSRSASRLAAVDGRARAVHVLDLDPALGERLDDADRAAARPHVVGELDVLTPGVTDLPAAPAAALVLDGPVLLRRAVAGGVDVEPLGDGDIVLVRDDPPARLLDVTWTWEAVEPARVVWLDARFALAARRWPALGLAVFERLEERVERIATLKAIAQLVRIDGRVLGALWHLSERWGRMTSDGVVLEMPLTHRMLADVIGARRPSVTTALGELQRQGRIVRRDDGWLLRGPAPAATDLTEASATG